MPEKCWELHLRPYTFLEDLSFRNFLVEAYRKQKPIGLSHSWPLHKSDTEMSREEKTSLSEPWIQVLASYHFLTTCSCTRGSPFSEPQLPSLKKENEYPYLPGLWGSNEMGQKENLWKPWNSTGLGVRLDSGSSLVRVLSIYVSVVLSGSTGHT